MQFLTLLLFAELNKKSRANKDDFTCSSNISSTSIAGLFLIIL
ncbi:hypothetical protein HMPREF1126_0821 [Streptococcus anginosus SK1138]|uniref:Uncharacterized protein n=1 Tax=Streptococcus anginosus SK1138 TaxID=1161422 RepID=A0AAD2T866_STRAP|nr:hypothetical protein HMPREF1126_0821 [Streptococcus anginosus SK1138]